MNGDKIEQMAQVTEALYLSEFRKIQSLLQEESRLRSSLARLQEQADGERQRLADDMPMQSIGADLLWQAWLVRSRKQLNIELSQVLAKKATALHQVRRAFGRRSAVQSMNDQLSAAQDATRRRKLLESLMQSHAGS